jgi:hypothetical protein
MRTVAFAIVVAPRACCDVAHAVTQRAPSTPCAEPPEAAPNPTTVITAKSTRILVTLVVLSNFVAFPTLVVIPALVVLIVVGLVPGRVVKGGRTPR